MSDSVIDSAASEPGTLITLRDALRPGRNMAKITAQSLTDSRCPRVLKPMQRMKIMPKLLDLNGYWYATNKWAATHDASKALGYKSILVTIEDEGKGL